MPWPALCTPLRAHGSCGARLSMAPRGRSHRLRVFANTGSKSDHRRAAAHKAVDQFVRPGAIVGLGSGEMVVMAIEYLGAKMANSQLGGITCIPGSSLAAHEAAFHGVPLSNLQEHPQVEVYLEEADQVDVAGGAFLKGIRAQPQQPELPKQREMMAAARQVILLADGANLVPRLNASLPVFIDAASWEETAEELDDIFLGDAEIWRRPTSGVANPRGGDRPYLSPENCHIVDVRFYEGLKLFGEDAKYENIVSEVDGIPGVLAHGLKPLIYDDKDLRMVVAEPSGAVKVLDGGALALAVAEAAEAEAAAAKAGAAATPAEGGGSKDQGES